MASMLWDLMMTAQRRKPKEVPPRLALQALLHIYKVGWIISTTLMDISKPFMYWILMLIYRWVVRIATWINTYLGCVVAVLSHSHISHPLVSMPPYRKSRMSQDRLDLLEENSWGQRILQGSNRPGFMVNKKNAELQTKDQSCWINSKFWGCFLEACVSYLQWFFETTKIQQFPPSPK